MARCLAGALAADDQYIAVRPGDPNPMDTRGDLYFMAGHDDDAIASYRKVLELRPDFSEYADTRFSDGAISQTAWKYQAGIATAQ